MYRTYVEPAVPDRGRVTLQPARIDRSHSHSSRGTYLSSEISQVFDKKDHPSRPTAAGLEHLP